MRGSGLFIWGMLVIVAPTANAESVTIGPIQNTSPKDVSSLSAECETAADGQRMTCSFVQIRVDLKKRPEVAAAEVEKQLQEVTPQQMTQVCKNQRQEMADLAAQITTTQDVTPGLKMFFTEWIQRFQAMCKKPTRESIREYRQYSLQKETKTCRIWANPWQETFTKQSRDKWVSNRGPNGICGVVTVSTLESEPIDPKKPDSLLRVWTYETQKIVTNKAAGGPFCDMDETRIRYSWDAKDFDRSCEFIEFGF
jgi:hypothetical protein